MNKEELISYWIESSDNDFRTMNHLFEKKDYTWALFVGHLIIEKLLKAYYVKNVDNTPPFIHNLITLSKKSRIKLSEERLEFMATVSNFNIRTRYDDYKFEFYKLCSKEFTKKWIKEITDFRKWIKEQLLKS